MSIEKHKEVMPSTNPLEFTQLTIQVPCPNNVAETVIVEAKALKEAKMK